MRSYDNKIIIKINKKQISILLIVILSMLCIGYFRIFKINYINSKFSKQMEEFVLNNENPVFNIEKIIIYSSASAVDKSESEVLQDMDISQYTDISLKINNRIKNNELSNENTIKAMYIDNINIENDIDLGETILNYKNPYIVGQYKDLEKPQDNKIEYKIVNTNQENDSANYDEPTFYSDCSNPITLGYINKNIVEGYGVSEDRNSIRFDGELLKNSNVKLKDIYFRISLQVHIVNNNNQEFICPVVIENDFTESKKEIYKEGYEIKTIDVNNSFIQTK